MLLIDYVLCWFQFILVCATVLASPWFFGSWEMWWFWPFAGCIFLSALIFGARLFLRTRGADASCIGTTAHPGFSGMVNLTAVAGLTYCGFLIYAVFRGMQSEVFMDAERSVLLFITPALLGVQVIFSFQRKMLRTLFILIFLNLCFLGLYGIINHFVTGSRQIMWAEGYSQYWKEGRASAPFYCPDHFAGALEICMALGLGLVLDRTKGKRWTLLGSAACLIALAGILMSKSRGGGLTVFVLGLSVAVYGFVQWSQAERRKHRLTAFAVLAAVIATVFIVPSPYMKRFTRYFKVQEQAVDESTPLHAAIADKIRKTSRGQMIPAAIRAWYSEPVFGIGPGMHKNVWPHIAASPDGDRELGIWPSQPNNHMHSYHVHSDWVQLLEEYGLVGFLLLLVPATCGFFLFRTGVNKERRRFEGTSTPQHNGYFTFMLAGLLAYIAMGFHSLGDFNLQIPAINWIFAVVITIPLGLTVGRRNPPSAVKK